MSLARQRETEGAAAAAAAGKASRPAPLFSPLDISSQLSELRKETSRAGAGRWSNSIPDYTLKSAPGAIRQTGCARCCRGPRPGALGVRACHGTERMGVSEESRTGICRCTCRCGGVGPTPAGEVELGSNVAVSRDAENLRAVRAEKALGEAKQHNAYLQKQLRASIRRSEANTSLAKRYDSATTQCEVCKDAFYSLAMHQVKSRHGKIWKARKAETGSSKKRRLIKERRERDHRFRAGKMKLPVPGEMMSKAEIRDYYRG